jgi:hypothetical protein
MAGSIAALHCICRIDDEGTDLRHTWPLDVHRGIHISGNWVFTENAAQSMVGGMLFLHFTKAKPSHLGGLILRYRMFDDVAFAMKHRVQFIFQIRSEARGVPWLKPVPSRAWTSGPFTVQVPWRRRVVNPKPFQRRDDLVLLEPATFTAPDSSWLLGQTYLSKEAI